MVGHSFVFTWMLVLITFVSPILTQNNTCHRIESYEVEVMVPIKEPVTFRSYTWCLKVPPRCSKYTVQYRERLTYETEVRNRTVSECCAGFVQLYSQCVPKCSECKNFNCNFTTNHCTCIPGYVGTLCNETCEDGKWGDRCSEVCICRIGEDCDKGTGVCTPKLTEDPQTQLVNISTTSPIISSQSSSVTDKPTTDLPTSSQMILKPHIARTLTYINDFVTAKPTTKNTSHSTALFTTLPSIAFTVPFTSVVENTSTITSTLSTQKSTMNSPLPPSDSNSTVLQTFVRNDFTVDIWSKKLVTNFTSTTLFHNVTPYVETTVTESVPEELLRSTRPDEITSTVKPKVTESITVEPKVTESATVEPKVTESATVEPQVIESTPMKVSTSTIEHSVIISTVKSQISKPVHKELPSTSETVLSTSAIPQKNYSKEISVEPSSDFSLNASMVYARWINEFSTNTSITLAIALVFLVLVIVTTSVIVHCCSQKSSQLSNGKGIKEENSPTLFSRNSHYDVPGPPTFSFINAYALDLLSKDIREANYDHPCSARCLVNEPVYDELRY